MNETVDDFIKHIRDRIDEIFELLKKMLDIPLSIVSSVEKSTVAFEKSAEAVEWSIWGVGFIILIAIVGHAIATRKK